MREDSKAKRQSQIEAAAYALLEEKGYSGTSMLAIARRAKASNETLYNWYSDKQGLFEVLVNRNASDVKALLEQELAQGSPPLKTLLDLGPLLLNVLTGKRAIALNRAAAADPTGALGSTLSKAGRDTIAPLISKVMARALAEGALKGTSPEYATEIYLNLLIGDLQIRRAIGRLPEPDQAEKTRRAQQAVQMLKQLDLP